MPADSRRICVQLTPREEAGWADKKRIGDLLEAIRHYLDENAPELTPRVFTVMKND